MTVSLSFGTVQEFETAFRALVIFKFSGCDDVDLYLGSPVMAAAASHMLEAIEAHWVSNGDSKRAESWRDSYRGGNIEHHVELISQCATRHPQWTSMSRTERLDWLQIIAAPYRIDEEGANFSESLLSR